MLAITIFLKNIHNHIWSALFILNRSLKKVGGGCGDNRTPERGHTSVTGNHCYRNSGREKWPKTWIGESRLQGEGILDLCLRGVLWLEKGRPAFQVGERRRGKCSLPAGGGGWQFCLETSLWYKVTITSILISFSLRMNVSCITANTLCVLTFLIL